MSSKHIGQQIADAAITSVKLEPNIALPGNAAAKVPAGTMAERPLSPANGMIRYNADISAFEVFSAGAWTSFSPTTTVAAVQGRRTTTQTLTATATVITFDTVDVVTKPGTLYRDGTNTGRFYATQQGLYRVSLYARTVDSNTTNTHTIQFRLNTNLLPGASGTIRPANNAATVDLTVAAICLMNPGDYLSAEILKSSGGGTTTMQIGCVVVIEKLDGAQGPAGPAGGTTTIYYPAATLDNPNNANWAVSALAPATADTSNISLLIRSFDDTLEEGVGCLIYVPPTAANVMFTLVGKCATAPATAKSVVLRLYSKRIAINAAVTAWTAPLQLTAINIPTNVFYQTFSQTIDIATLGFIPGNNYQLEITRQGSNVADTLVGDFQLLNMTISFS